MIKNIKLRIPCSAKDTTKKDAVGQFLVKLKLILHFIFREKKQEETFWDNWLFYLLVCNITFPSFSQSQLQHNHFFISQLNNLTRVQQYRTPEWKPFIFPSFTKPWFIYCPLKWIFRTKHSTGGINNKHKQCFTPYPTKINLTSEYFFRKQKQKTSWPKIHRAPDY